MLPLMVSISVSWHRKTTVEPLFISVLLPRGTSAGQFIVGMAFNTTLVVALLAKTQAIAEGIGEVQLFTPVKGFNPRTGVTVLFRY